QRSVFLVPQEGPEGETLPQSDFAGDHIPPNVAPAFPIELSIAVTTALGKLHADQREAVILKIYQGFKFEEMAEILSCPASTVKSRLYTALDVLKTQLDPAKSRGVA